MTVSSFRNPPSPGGWPLIGELPRIIPDPPGYCAQAVLRHRDLVRLDLGFAWLYVVALPEHIQHVLVDEADRYWKGPMFNRARFFFGNGLVLNEGDGWRRQRRRMNPAFQHRRIASLMPILTGVVEEKVERWEQARAAGTPVEMQREMMSLTLRIILRTMFGLSVDEAQLDRLAVSLEAALRHMSLRMFTFFLPEWVPLPGAAECRRAKAFLEGEVRRIVAERRREEDAGEARDLLSMLLEARDEESGEGMTDLELRDEVMTTIFGGYEATAGALAWTWHLLAAHPEVAERLRTEALEVLDDRRPTFEDLGRLKVAERVAMEVMRLYPPFWDSPRAAAVDDEVGGWHVPAGSTVIICPYATHRLPDLWDDPERFDPDRFLPERVAGRHRHAWIPFGTGPRVCIGRHLAMMEMQLILAMVARTFRPVPVPGRPVVQVAGATLTARHGIWMHLEKAGR